MIRYLFGVDRELIPVNVVSFIMAVVLWAAETPFYF